MGGTIAACACARFTVLLQGRAENGFEDGNCARYSRAKRTLCRKLQRKKGIVARIALEKGPCRKNRRSKSTKFQEPRKDWSKVAVGVGLFGHCGRYGPAKSSAMPIARGVFFASIPTLVKRAFRPKWLSSRKMGRQRWPVPAAGGWPNASAGRKKKNSRRVSAG
jgi:hypothetical protein